MTFFMEVEPPVATLPDRVPAATLSAAEEAVDSAAEEATVEDAEPPHAVRAMAAAAAPQTVINERRVIFFIFISSKQVRAVCPGIFCCAFPGNGFIVPRRRPRCDQPRAKWR